MLLRWFASWTCIVRASSASSYSCRATTRRAMYSKTSLTPSPVFADVKKSFGYRSRGGGGTYEFEGDTPSSGVVAVVVPACPRMKRLGVMVGAEEMDELEGMRRGDRYGELEGERERGADRAVRAGEDRADWKVSNREEEGVWYIECVVVMVPTVPPPRKSVERLLEREPRDVRRRLTLGEPMLMESDRGATRSASRGASSASAGISSSS